MPRQERHSYISNSAVMKVDDGSCDESSGEEDVDGLPV